jgi:hypothetical protein
MKMFALPENVINEAFTLLQKLPFQEVVTLLPKMQKARALIDINGNPLLDADLTSPLVPVDSTVSADTAATAPVTPAQ